MKHRFALLAALATLTALPLGAQSNDLGVWIATSQVGNTTEEGATLDFDNGQGFGVSFNHFFGDALSAEISATALSHDGNIALSGQNFLDVGSLDIIPVVGTVQWHFARHARLSPYLGIGAAYIMADDLQSDDLDLVGIGKVEVGSKVTWAAQAGINVPIGTRFAIGVDAKYIAYKPESRAAGDSETLDLDLNPVVLSAGFKIRW